MATTRPTKEVLEQAVGRRVPDVIGADLAVLFCGINPGLWSGAVGHHFAHPGNRFWKALQLSGFTDEVLAPSEERRLLEVGLGITNLVPVATRAASDLTTEELRTGERRLQSKVRRYRPRAVAVLGLLAYRGAFRRPKAALGRQPDDLEGAQLWVLANPSGLQGRYPLPALSAQLRELRASVSRPADT